MTIHKEDQEFIDDGGGDVRLVKDQRCEDARLERSAVLRRVHDLRELSWNWNGYGGAPIAPDILKAAERFVSEMPVELAPSPRVVPMTRGRLQFEWHCGERSLELEFESPEFVHYLKTDSVAGIEEEDVIPIERRGKILELLDWFSAK